MFSRSETSPRLREFDMPGKVKARVKQVSSPMRKFIQLAVEAGNKLDVDEPLLVMPEIPDEETDQKRKKPPLGTT